MAYNRQRNQDIDDVDDWDEDAREPGRDHHDDDDEDWFDPDAQQEYEDWLASEFDDAGE